MITCPECGNGYIDSRRVYDTTDKKRWRHKRCRDCGAHFKTVEMITDQQPPIDNNWISEKDIEMRTRLMGYNEYGVTPGEEKEILKFCRSCKMPEKAEILKISHEVNEFIGDELYFSIVEGVSYDKITEASLIPIGKNDFYGYRRKCLGEIKEKMCTQL